MDEYIVKGGKSLRLGYTSGSCAAAAAKAAAVMLLTGNAVDSVPLVTPKGIRLELPVHEVRFGAGCVSCAVRKDSGDDPDVTDGMLVFAEVSRSDGDGILIDGGAGVGRVTKPGLDQPVGAAAINSVPRKMIREALEDVQRLTDDSGGLKVVISVPDGERLARKTFNPRLGIVGGISILGTTGIVEPMSEQALVDTIRIELRQRRECGHKVVLLTPGNYGADFIRDGLGIEPGAAVLTSNFIGDALDFCVELGFSGILLVGHIGKLVKLAGGMFNTHSKYGDCRMEILGAYAAACGAGPAQVAEILECVSCDEALRILRDAGADRTVLDRIVQRILYHLRNRVGEQIETGAITFSKVYGELGRTENAGKLAEMCRVPEGPFGTCTE